MDKACVFPVLAALALCLLPFSSALPNGAPPSACEDMMPRHRGIQPQTSNSPYTIQLDVKYDSVEVRITGPPYGGLLLEFRSPPDTTAIGSWPNPPANTKNLKCSENEKGAITHANPTPKTNATVYTWVPPTYNCPTTATLKLTVAQSHDVYWTNMESKPLLLGTTSLCKSASSGSSAIKKTTWTSGILLHLAVPLFLFLGCTY